jgi:hypothetical protein
VGLEVLHSVELDAVGDFPAFGQARNDLGRAALEFGQPIIDGPRRVEAGAGGVDCGSEILRTAFRATDQGLRQSEARAREHGGQRDAGTLSCIPF